jgi:hypothetical protein
MKSKKVNIKKIIYISILSILGVIFLASIIFGVIAAFTNNARSSIELWYLDSFKKEISLLKHSITWLLISSALLIFTLSFKEFKNKYID